MEELNEEEMYGIVGGSGGVAIDDGCKLKAKSNGRLRYEVSEKVVDLEIVSIKDFSIKRKLLKNNIYMYKNGKYLIEFRRTGSQFMIARKDYFNEEIKINIKYLNRINQNSGIYQRKTITLPPRK